MAYAIARRLAERRRTVTLAGRSQEGAERLASTLVAEGADAARIEATTAARPIAGDVVMLAIPYTAAVALAETRGDELAGRIVVDLTNPVDWDTMDALVTPPGRSGAEEIARKLPRSAAVVKAFNTTFAKRLSRTPSSEHPLDLFVAADDEDAKQQLAELCEGTGLRLIDAGPLRRARELEALGFLHISLQDRLGTGFETAIEVVR